MPAVKGGSYGGVSATERQEERRRRLLAAGLEVIGTEGLAAASVRAVCREAGLSARFFYESFPGVEELALALIDQVFEQATAAVLAAVEGIPLAAAERNRVAIETFVRELTGDRRVARLVLMESLGSEALARRRLTQVRSVVEAAMDQKRDLRPAEVSTAYREVVATVMIGGLIELLVAWMNGGIDGELSDIVADYARLNDEVVATIHGIHGRPGARDA